MFYDNVRKEKKEKPPKQNNCVSTGVELSGFTLVVSLDVVFHFWTPQMRRKRVKSAFHPPGAASHHSDFTAGLPPPQAPPPQRVAAVKWGESHAVTSPWTAVLEKNARKGKKEKLRSFRVALMHQCDSLDSTFEPNKSIQGFRVDSGGFVMGQPPDYLSRPVLWLCHTVWCRLTLMREK